jgi:hypothetical protein
MKEIVCASGVKILTDEMGSFLIIFSARNGHSALLPITKETFHGDSLEIMIRWAKEHFVEASA